MRYMPLAQRAAVKKMFVMTLHDGEIQMSVVYCVRVCMWGGGWACVHAHTPTPLIYTVCACNITHCKR